MKFTRVCTIPWLVMEFSTAYFRSTNIQRWLSYTDSWRYRGSLASGLNEEEQHVQLIR